MFWIGLIWGTAIGVGAMWLAKKGFGIKWYEWLMGAISLLLITVTVQHYFGSLNEFEPKAAWMGSLILGLAAVVIAALAFQLVWRRNKASG